MLTLAVSLGFLGIGIFCWLMFAAAIYALPCAVGLSVFLHAQQAGSGALAAIVLGFLAGAVVLVIGQLVFSLMRNPVLRATLALIFAVPAARRRLFRDVGHRRPQRFFRYPPARLRNPWRYRDRHHRLGTPCHAAGRHGGSGTPSVGPTTAVRGGPHAASCPSPSAEFGGGRRTKSP